MAQVPRTPAGACGRVTEKKNPAACDDRALKANFNIQPAQNSAPAFRIATAYLVRRFGLAPARATLIARLCFGEMRL